MGRNLHAQINAPPTSAHTPPTISDAPARVRCVLAFALNVGAGVGADAISEIVGKGVCDADAPLKKPVDAAIGAAVGAAVSSAVGVEDGAALQGLVST